jgi:hypothetical protein
MEYKNIRLSAEQRENLVAYLDRELDDQQSHDIENVLARSEVARHEVEALARTWELLDLLPKPTAREDFTERTLTTIKVSELRPRLSDQPWFDRARKGAIGVLWVAGLAACGVLGVLITAKAIPDRQAELLSELPLYRNLDVYLEIDSVDYVKNLERMNLFSGSEGASVQKVDPTPFDVSRATVLDRYRQVAEMPQLDRDHLVRNEQIFRQLPLERQLQLRELHQQLSTEPSTLWSTIEAYALWVQTLTPGQRDDLRRAESSTQRQDLVRQFHRQQTEQREGMLLAPDPARRKFRLPPAPYLSEQDLVAVEGVLFGKLQTSDRERIKRDLPDESLTRQIHVFRAAFSAGGRPPRGPIPEAWIDEMTAAISSSDVKQRLDALPVEQRRRETIVLTVKGLAARISEQLNQYFPTQKELMETFSRVEGEERYRLMQLTSVELTERLTDLYFKQLAEEKPMFAQAIGMRHMLFDFARLAGDGPRFPGFNGGGRRGMWPGGPGGPDGGPPRPGPPDGDGADRGPGRFDPLGFPQDRGPGGGPGRDGFRPPFPRGDDENRQGPPRAAPPQGEPPPGEADQP